MLSRLVVTLMLLTSIATSASAGMRDASFCKKELDATWASLNESSTRVQRAGNAKGDEACVAYRSYFLDVVKTRSVTAQCTTGPERDQQLGKLDIGAEQANDGIAARCG